jgi:hypothetical protein
MLQAVGGGGQQREGELLEALTVRLAAAHAELAQHKWVGPRPLSGGAVVGRDQGRKGDLACLVAPPGLWDMMSCAWCG